MFKIKITKQNLTVRDALGYGVNDQIDPKTIVDILSKFVYDDDKLLSKAEGKEIILDMSIEELEVALEQFRNAMNGTAVPESSAATSN